MKHAPHITRSAIPALVLCLLLTACDASPVGVLPPEDDAFSSAPVYRTDAPGAAVEGAHSELLTGDAGLEARLATHGLRPDETYSLWIYTFEQPQECLAGTFGVSHCGQADLADPRTGGRAELACGYVTATERATFLCWLGEPDWRTDAEDGSEDGPEVLLVVRSHGASSPDEAEQALAESGGTCPPDACRDVQLAAHAPS